MYVLWISLYPPLVDHEPKKFFGGHADCTLEWIHLYAINPEDIEHIGQVDDVVRGNFGLDEHVIYINLYCLANLFLEHHINQTLVGRSYVLESKGHHLVAVQVVVYDERGMLLIQDVHGDLIIP